MEDEAVVAETAAEKEKREELTASLKVSFSIEALQDLKAVHGLSLFDILKKPLPAKSNLFSVPRTEPTISTPIRTELMTLSSVELYPYQVEMLLKVGMISRMTADEMLRGAPTPASQEAPVQEAMTSELGSRRLQL
jgi:hypothetical protein